MIGHIADCKDGSCESERAGSNDGTTQSVQVRWGGAIMMMADSSPILHTIVGIGNSKFLIASRQACINVTHYGIKCRQKYNT